MKTNQPITQIVTASPLALYSAMTDRRALKEWFCHEALTIPRANGPLCLWWKDGTYAVGEFVSVNCPSPITMRWQDAAGDPAVSVTIKLQEHQEGTQVSVDLEGREENVSAFRSRWTNALPNLSIVFGEKGLDQRLVRTPCGETRATLGFFVGPTAPAISPDLPPHTRGMRVVGTIDGTSAHEAGLRRDDVVLDVAGHPVFDLFTYSHALDHVRPEEDVVIRYVRTGRIATATFAASAGAETLPLPPRSAEEFADHICQRYDEFDQELNQLLVGVTEERAKQRPSPNAWCINEVLAHLIPFERMFHHWMAATAVGFEPYNWVEHPPLWMAGLLDVFPSLSQLREELRRARSETVAYLRHLPDDLVRRPTYQRMGMVMLLDQFHPQHHHAQIHRILEALDAQ